MNMINLYEQLTGVDLEKQEQLWNERGKGYFGEYLVFCELYKSIPGNGKILMNLNIPVAESKTTEIDLVLIHETGLYVFEVKHYKGTIYGKENDSSWTQYFKTSPNHTFLNPIEQNRYHISALKNQFLGMPIHSCIVFTNRECNLQVQTTSKDIDVCPLRSLPGILSSRFKESKNTFSMEEIEKVFQKLSVYSQMKEPVVIDGKEANFFSWVQPVINRLEEKKNELEKEKGKLILGQEELKKKETACKRSKRATVVVSLILSLLFTMTVTMVSFFICKESIAQKEQELSEFKQNFLHIDEINNKYIDALNSYLDVSEVTLTPLTDDAVNFSAKITVTNTVYCVVLPKTAKYIVITTSGKVFEYDVFDKNKFTLSRTTVGKGSGWYSSSFKFGEVQFYGITDIEEISCVKVTGVEIVKAKDINTVLKDKLEIELYSK